MASWLALLARTQGPPEQTAAPCVEDSSVQMSVMETRCRLQRGRDPTTVEIRLHFSTGLPRVEVGFN